MLLPPLSSFYTSHHPVFRKALCPMCSLGFKYCQETASGGCSCATVAYLAYAYFWRGRGLGGGHSAPLPWTVWIPWMAGLTWGQNEEQGLDCFSCNYWMGSAQKCRISRLLSLMLVKRIVGRSRAGYGAAGETPKWGLQAGWGWGYYYFTYHYYLWCPHIWSWGICAGINTSDTYTGDRKGEENMGGVGKMSIAGSWGPETVRVDWDVVSKLGWQMRRLRM